MVISSSPTEVPPYPGACKCKLIYIAYIYMSLNTPVISSLLEYSVDGLVHGLIFYSLFDIDWTSLFACCYILQGMHIFDIWGICPAFIVSCGMVLHCAVDKMEPD